MPRLHKIYFALAAAHLLMVALFASHMAEWAAPPAAVSAVGNYTGSNNIFSFFAPGLSDQPYVVYALKDSLNNEHIIDLNGNSPDFSKRINNIYGFLTIKEARPVISASLARFMLNRYPSTDKVRVAMVVQQIPQMDEYRTGKRIQWRFWFHRDFQRDSLSLAHN
jgi:hypothetical protein